MQPKLRFCLISAATLLALPASAAAGTKSKSVTATGHFAIVSATAKCPSGQQATGGGFATVDNANPNIRVYESRKVRQRSWRASGQIFDGGGTNLGVTLTAFVYCSKDAPSTRSKSATVMGTSGNTLFGADARCGPGKAQAGGFLGTPPFTPGTSRITDSYRVDKKTWRSRMLLMGFAPGITVTSYVYCADAKKPSPRSASTTSATAGTLHRALSAKCKRGTKPVAGGFSQPNATATPQGNFTRFSESFRSGKQWLVSASHFGAESTTLNSIAYCG
jgi:hypothetical protein